MNTDYDTSTTPTYVAEHLGVEVADVELVMRWLNIAPVNDRITGEQCSDVTGLLDPHYERRIPELFGQADVDWRDDEPPKPHGLGSPT